MQNKRGLLGLWQRILSAVGRPGIAGLLFAVGMMLAGQLSSPVFAAYIDFIGANSVPMSGLAPTANPAGVSTPTNIAVALTLTGSDPEEDPLTFAISSPPLHGTLSGTPPDVTYTPVTDYHGPDSFSFTVDDSTTVSDPATISINVNTVPDAVDDTATVGEDSGSNIITVLVNDTDVDGDPRTVTAVTQGSKGVAAVGVAGANVTYTTNPNENGGDTFTYTINDGQGGTDTATVSITITAVNDAPVVTGILDQTIAEGASFTTIALDDYVSDADNTDAEMAWSYSGNTDLTVDIVARVATISIPNTDWNGAETITFRATDPGTLFGEDSAIFTVTAVNDAPVLGAIGAKSVNELAPLTFTATASDADTLPTPDTLTYSLADGTSGLVPAGAAIDSNSGGFSWTPTEAQGPAVNTFDVCVSDGTVSDCETITVTVNEVNLAPVLAVIGDTGGPEGTLITFDADATDSDNPAHTLTYSLEAGDPSGVAINPSSGVFTWTPSEAQGPGVYTVTVVVTDNGAPVLADSQEATLTVTEVNQPPAALDDTLNTVVEDSSNNIINVLSNDTDGDLPANALIVTAVSLASKGIVTIGPEGAHVVYTPNLNANGSDTFTYTISDGMGGTDTGMVTVTITSVNDAPVGGGDDYFVNSHMGVNTDTDPEIEYYRLTVSARGVLGNDSDIDGGTLTTTLITPPETGSLILSPDGSFIYTYPAGLLQDAVSFVYTLSDGQGGTDTATVNIIIDLVPLSVVAQWLEPFTAPSGAYYGITPITGTTETVPLKVFVADITGVDKVEFRWFDHSVSPGVWHVIGADGTPALENDKQVYTSALDLTPLPYIDDIQVWAWTYDTAGNHTGIGKVGGFDYWSRILVNHYPSGYNVFLPFIRR